MTHFSYPLCINLFKNTMYQLLVLGSPFPDDFCLTACRILWKSKNKKERKKRSIGFSFRKYNSVSQCTHELACKNLIYIVSVTISFSIDKIQSNNYFLVYLKKKFIFCSFIFVFFKVFLEDSCGTYLISIFSPLFYYD